MAFQKDPEHFRIFYRLVVDFDGTLDNLGAGPDIKTETIRVKYLAGGVHETKTMFAYWMVAIKDSAHQLAGCSIKKLEDAFD